MMLVGADVHGWRSPGRAGVGEGCVDTAGCVNMRGYVSMSEKGVLVGEERRGERGGGRDH